MAEFPPMRAVPLTLALSREGERGPARQPHSVSALVDKMRLRYRSVQPAYAESESGALVEVAAGVDDQRLARYAVGPAEGDDLVGHVVLVGCAL